MTDKRFSPLFTAFIAMGLALATLGGAQAADDQQANKIKPLVIINGTILTNQDVGAFARSISTNRRQQIPPNELMNTLIDRELLFQEAMAKGYDKRPDVANELKNQKRSLLANVTVNEILQANPPTDEQLHKIYKDRVLSQKLDEYKARHILVKTEGEAKDIITKLDKGEDFSKLAKEKSTDTASAEKGGDLGWFGPNQMVPEFTKAAAALTKGKYTKAPVKSRFGWHIILLDDTRPITPPKFEDMKTQLQGAAQNEIVSKYLGELRKKAKIEQPK